MLKSRTAAPIVLSLLVMSMFIQSCNSQNFDLSSIVLPVKESSITSKFQLEDQNFQVAGLDEYISMEKDALYFEGESLYGSIDNSPNTSYMANFVKFYIDKKTNQIEAYKLETKTTQETKKLEKALEAKFGKTFYHYKDPSMTFRIWEYKNNTYFLEINYTTVYNDKASVTGDLCVVNNKADGFYNYYMAGGFGYYQDYLRAKKENLNKNYTYNDFLNEMKEEGNDYYLNKIVR